MAPSPLLQRINRTLHTEPLASIFHTVFWSFVLFVGCPFAGTILLLSSPLRIIYAFFNDLRRIDSHKEGIEYGVVVTGCDCGFGRDVAFELSKRGFVVFAGCRCLDDCKGQFEGSNNIIPLQMDVTNQKEISEAVSTVSNWTSGGTNYGDSNKRVIHAIINNAGNGSTSLFDWYERGAISSDVDVNFYGSVYVVYEFLHLLKKQYQINKQNTPQRPRIINIISMAGLVNGTISASMYHASKYAMEGFSASLRGEVYPFGIDVINVNPSFHRTNIVSGLRERLVRSWEGMDREKRGQYGEEFVNKVASKVEKNFSQSLWEPNVVVDTILTTVELKYPSCQYIVGSDAKTVMMLFRWLPQPLLSWLIRKDYGLPNVNVKLDKDE